MRGSAYISAEKWYASFGRTLNASTWQIANPRQYVAFHPLGDPPPEISPSRLELNSNPCCALNAPNTCQKGLFFASSVHLTSPTPNGVTRNVVPIASFN